MNIKMRFSTLISNYEQSRVGPSPHSRYISNEHVECSSTVKNIGVVFNKSLSLLTHVIATCKAAFFHLRNISKIRRFLVLETTKTIVHAFVTSKLDYCNSLLYNQPKYKNCAAKLIHMSNKYDHVTPLLINLHQLPVQERIKFKILTIALKALHGQAPPYICDLLKPYCPASTLRSSSQNLLNKPAFNLKTYGGCSFSICAPTLWNLLLTTIKNSTSLDVFKTLLKTWLFSKAIIN